MIQPTDILSRRNEIKDCLAFSEMEKAIKRLMDFVRDFCEEAEDDVILISRRYYDLKKRDRLKTIEYEEIRDSEVKIAKEILEILRLVVQKMGNQP